MMFSLAAHSTIMKCVWRLAISSHVSIGLVCIVLTRSIVRASAKCNAEAYGLPGFRSQPSDERSSGSNVYKVAFRNIDGTWLAGNFRDTGSDFVVALFLGLGAHKEDWPASELMETLAQTQGLSSLAVDVAGRGESCGYELALNYTAALNDMAAAVHFINSLPGRYCGSVVGLSSAAAACVFYAAQVADVPSMFMLEPDDFLIMPEWLNFLAGGDVEQRLQRAPEIEITFPYNEDRMIIQQQSYHLLSTIDLQAEVAQIPSDLHLHWYTAEYGSSTSSEMKDLSFAHLNHFSHRHFPEARHDFASSPDFLITAAKDIADEAFGQAFAKDYLAKHPQPPQYTVCSKPDQTAPSLAAMTTGKRTMRMPKHFFLSPEYTSSMDHGLVNPAAVYLAPHGWVMTVIPFQGCFGSDCPSQIERAFTPPLLAYLGKGNKPDPHHVSDPKMMSFNNESWAVAIRELSAHTVGGLRFSSFRLYAPLLGPLPLRYRPFVYARKLHLSYALEIFDQSLDITPGTPSSQHKMRFQGTGFAQVDLGTLQLHSIVNFAQPLIPRRDPPCCDKNWGVWTHDEDLYILYTIVPCLTIFKVDLNQQRQASFVFASCLQDNTGTWLSQAASLDLHDVRISGHPVLWSQYPHTLLVLVHHNWRKHQGSKHWAVLLQFHPERKKFMLSAVSEDAVLDHQDYYLYNQAVLNVIAVGSYHLWEDHLRIFYGDGDKYSAFADVHLSSIVWLRLNATSAAEWESGLDTLGDRISSITHTEYRSLVWK